MEKKLVILIPSYEPDDKLIKLVDEINFKKLDIVIVDDGSGIEYKNIFDSCKKKAHIISYKKNKGKGYALKTGIKYIKNTYKENYVIVTMDCDGQHRINDAIKLYKYVSNSGNTLFLGKRIRGKNTPLRSKLGNIITMLVYKIITHQLIYDTQTGLRAFSDELTDYMLKIEGKRFEYEMNVLLNLKRKGINVKEIEISTIYLENNKGTHFKTIRDSYLIYKDIFKFSCSSIMSFLIDFILYSTLFTLFKNISISNILARTISATINYNLNRKIVFKNEDNIYKSFTKYVLLCILILFLNTIILNILVKIVIINAFIAKIITELLLFIFSYFVQKNFIFKGDD